MGLRTWAERRRRIGDGADAEELAYGPDDPKAIPYLEGCIRRHPEDPEFQLQLAVACLHTRKSGVVPAARRAAELAPADPLIQLRAGRLLIDHEDGVKAATQCAVRAREQALDNVEFLAGLAYLEGCVAAREGDFELVEEKFRDAVELEPENARNALTLAHFYWAWDRDDEAVAVIDGALRSGGKFSDDQLNSLSGLRAEITGEPPPGD